MRYVIALTLLISTLSCQHQQEHVEKFAFDSKQINSKEVHRYDFFGDGKIKADYFTLYVYSAGVMIDSSVHASQYQYSDNGKVRSIINQNDSSMQLKYYNKLDSLIADYSINRFGDTTMLANIDYDGEKIIRRTMRALTTKFPEDLRDLKKIDFRNYDTAFYITEFMYNGSQIIKSLSLEKNRTVTAETEYRYEEDNLAETITLTLLGDEKFIKERTVYINSKTSDPDYFIIGIRGDTTGFKRTIFQNNQKIITYYYGDADLQDIMYYNSQGQLIGSIIVELANKIKTITALKYDDRGNILERTTYRERMIDQPNNLIQNSTF